MGGDDYRSPMVDTLLDKMIPYAAIEHDSIQIRFKKFKIPGLRKWNKIVQAEEFASESSEILDIPASEQRINANGWFI